MSDYSAFFLMKPEDVKRYAVEGSIFSSRRRKPIALRSVTATSTMFFRSGLGRTAAPSS